MAGTAWALQEAGQPTHGFDGVIVTTLPIGSGLSSSAALEVVSAWALSGPAGPALAPLDLARIAQRAENGHVGVQCGLMDQFASACGVADHALLFDCRSLDWRAVPLPDDLALVVIHSGVSHAHGDNEYNARRAACERVVAAIARDDPAVTLLRDVDMARLDAYREQLDPVDYDRAYHVITENDRVLEAVAALEADDHAALGELMAGSQASMRDRYDITCPEIDELVAISVDVPGVVGSRMTGGGFGGCTVSLVRPDAVEALRERVERDYPARTGKTPAPVDAAGHGRGRLRRGLTRPADDRAGEARPDPAVPRAGRGSALGGPQRQAADELLLQSEEDDERRQCDQQRGGCHQVHVHEVLTLEVVQR